MSVQLIGALHLSSGISAFGDFPTQLRTSFMQGQRGIREYVVYTPIK